MATVVKRKKPLAVSPLKASQTIGASIAFLGVDRSIPLMHGSQGCTAFAKVFFVRHYREPVPLQTTAMDHASSVMGADENVVIGLKTVCEKAKPALVGLTTTGLAEAQGCDVVRNVKEFRSRYPEFDSVRVVPVNTPDFAGSFERGFAAAVAAMIDVLVPASDEAGADAGTVNILAGSLLSVGDLEWLKETVESFGLTPVVLPDLSDSLDGHLTDRDFSPVSVGGMPVDRFATLGRAAATVVVGRSMTKAADLLADRTGVPDHRFDHLMGLAATDRLLLTLAEVSGRTPPARFGRQRSQLQDAMLDTHFTLGQARVAIAADPDLIVAFDEVFASMGAEVVAAVSPAGAPYLGDVSAPTVQIGDLEDLENSARDGRAELVVGNSHAAASARRLGVPLLRAGFPQYDYLGGYQRCWSGYRATRQTLFDLSNTLTAHREESVAVYRSAFSQKRDRLPGEDPNDATGTTDAGCGSHVA